jgi:hypothetical protein
LDAAFQAAFFAATLFCAHGPENIISDIFQYLVEINPVWHANCTP